MSLEFIDDTFLARWLAGELTKSEEEAFQQHPDFAFYQQLKRTHIQLDASTPDQAKLLNKIKNNPRFSKRTEAKQKTLIPRKWLSIAATLLLLVLSYYYFSNIDFTKPDPNQLIVGNQILHHLPDGSTVYLINNAAVSYDPKTFLVDRKISLKGHGFFDVQKGSTFNVETDNGIVEVLGTSFSVFSVEKLMWVACKTGKVAATSNLGKKTIINPGERVVIEDRFMYAKDSVDIDEIGNWPKESSKFNSENLFVVCKALENQFKITIELDKEYYNDKFTGSFLHNDINTALQMVFVPMGLDFQKKDDQTYIIKAE